MILGAALQADGENEVRIFGLKHQKEKRSMDHFAGLDVSVKELRSPSLARKSARIIFCALEQVWPKKQAWLALPNYSAIL